MNLGTNTKAILLLFILTVIIYSNSLGGDFVYDDGYFIVKNIHIKNLENIPSLFVSSCTTAFAELSQDVYRPVTTVTFALDYYLWKLNTFCYHLENVLLHAANAILLFLLLDLVLADAAIAFLASLLFALHPVQTEVVSWISGRSSVLCLFFYLGALIFYIRFLKESKKAYLAVSAAFYAVSLFSKEMAISLPLLLIAYDFHFPDKATFRQRLYRYAPFVLLAAFYITARFLILNRVSQCAWWGGSPYRTFLSMAPVIIDYIKTLVFPLQLRVFYILPIRTSIADPKVLGALCMLTGALFAMLPIFRRSRRVSFFICWFFITLVPVSNIVPLRALMAERFLYIPSIGFCVLVAILIRTIAAAKPAYLKRFARAAAAMAAALLVVMYGARTMARNEDWKSHMAITASLLKIDPLNTWGLTSLGIGYITEERYDMAVKALTKSIHLSDGNFSPRSVLGFCYLQLGRYEDAARILSEALKLYPRNVEALNSLGVAYANLKRYKEAVGEFEAALRVDKYYAEGYLNLGTAYDHMGQSGKAIEEYLRVEQHTKSRQDVAISYLRIGDVYSKLKKPEEAKRYYKKAIGLCGRNMDDLRKIATDRLNARFVDK